MSNMENNSLDIAESILEWFKTKGIQSGNPSSIVESYHEINLRQVLKQKESINGVSSSLLSRRLKHKLTLGWPFDNILFLMPLFFTLSKRHTSKASLLALIWKNICKDWIYDEFSI